MDHIYYIFTLFKLNYKLTKRQLNYLLNNINPLLLKNHIPYFKWLCSKYMTKENLETCLKRNPSLLEYFI